MEAREVFRNSRQKEIIIIKYEIVDGRPIFTNLIIKLIRLNKNELWEWAKVE